MHCITIVFGPAATTWTFLYKTPETARSAHEKLTALPVQLAAPSITETSAGLSMAHARVMHESSPIPPVVFGMAYIQDDFGQSGTIPHNAIHGIMVEDLDQSKLAHVERAIHNAKTNSEAQKRAQADPSLRGPAMIAPGGMGNGMFPRQ